jgi:hypothetical protein
MKKSRKSERKAEDFRRYLVNRNMGEFEFYAGPRYVYVIPKGTSDFFAMDINSRIRSVNSISKYTKDFPFRLFGDKADIPECKRHLSYYAYQKFESFDELREYLLILQLANL